MDELRASVYELVDRIPAGRVMSYGQIAALCGYPRHARFVGQIAHWGPEELPWHRVVHQDGRLASGYSWGGREGQRQALAAEGVAVAGYCVENIEDLRWWPDEQ